MAHILVTGGAGYIGSATCKHLAEAGHIVTVFDNLSTGHAEFVRWGNLIEGDVRDTIALKAALRNVDGVIHFAAASTVAESVTRPGHYYDVNVGGTLSLLDAMRAACVGAIVVSSTCAVYGEPDRIPITEDTPKVPINPYGMTKLVMERMCADFDIAHGLRSVALRYFNACGCDGSFEVGERHDPETHLIPRIFAVLDGDQDAFQLFGEDYSTDDGTCIRDYIHVSDLAMAHCRAIDHLLGGGASEAVNLGTGKGTSVHQILDAVWRVTGHSVPVSSMPRRIGDPAVLIADPERARALFEFSPSQSNIEHIVRTAWQWHQQERSRGPD